MSDPLWTLWEVRAAVQGKTAGKDTKIHGVSIDSRTVAPGDLFIALKGPNFDGHAYVAAALETGAAACLVSDETVFANQATDAPLILVENTEVALTELGIAARARFSGQVIGITGSVGKTTTRALTSAAFGSFSQTHATHGNLNNHLGVPLTLARLPQNAETAVIEMGMNHFGEIEALSQLAKPHIALITAIDWVHSENLDGTLEGVAKAKAEICAGLSGPLFAPHGLKDLLEPHIGSQEVVWIEEPFAGPMALPGEENRWNAALALAAVPAGHRGLAEAAIAQVSAEPGRGDVLELSLDGKSITVFNDAYNAAPASMEAAIRNLMARRGGRRIAIVGDMAELADPEQHHKNLGKFLAEMSPDMVVAVGNFHSSILVPLPPSIGTAGWNAPEQVVPHLRPLLRQDDQILVKASNSTNLARVVADLQAASDRS